MKHTISALVCILVLAAAAPLLAGSAQNNLNVSAAVSAVCTITTSPVAFGPYDPVSANATTDLTASGSVNVACTKGATATIDLGNGGGFLGGTRRMSNGTDFLNYALYKDAARTQAWGSGLAGGTTATYNSTSIAVAALTVYGTVPQAQDVSVGSYSDIVLATINY